MTLPKKIGSYQIRGELGGHGQVRLFRAYDSLTGEVAIKLLPADFFGDADFRARFDREVQALALLENPVIVPLMDLDHWEGRPYLVTRYLAGGSLADRLAQGALPLEDAYRILYDLASALDAAAERGVTHGNIKPSNILFDEVGEVYLSDFSLVPPSQSRPASTLNILPDTAAYLSPEQVLHGHFDRQSDIYALGAVLYHMLTGQPPVGGMNTVQQAVRQVADPPPDVLAAKPDLPAGCQMVISRAMAKDPTQRYATASEMVDALAEAIELATKPSVETAKANSRHRALAWALASLSLVLVTALAAGFFLVGPERLNAFLWTPTPTPLPPIPSATQTASIMPSASPSASPSATVTPNPTSTLSPLPLQVTEASSPTSTPTLEPTLPIIGGASQIAFLNENDIWIANLDGTGLERLTQDKIPKEDLAWTPDGKALTYLMNGCVQMLDMESRQVQNLGCYPDFAISPDMSQIVIGNTVTLPNKNKQWMNFIMPYDLKALRSLGLVPQREQNGGCPFIGGQHTHFSADGKTLAAVFNSPGASGRLEDLIVVFRLGACGQEFDRLDMFPGTRFKLRGYSGPTDSPTITDFGWDGGFLFALHGDVVNGYGDLVIYNRSSGNAKIVNPIEGQCCYKDMQWSPDGVYFLFAYQDGRLGNNARLYYVRYGDIGTGAVFAPLDLPFYFFNQPRAEISPALRPYVP